MVRCFHLESHLLQSIDNRSPRILTEIDRSEVEVRAHIVRHCGRFTVRSELEHEELCFHPRVHRAEAEFLRVVELTSEHTARVAVEWLSIRCRDVADQSRNSVFRITPREYLERRHVRREEHVRLFDSDKPFDR